MLPTLALLLIGAAAPAPGALPAEAIAPGAELACVEDPPPGATAALRADGITVVRDLGSCLLVLVDPADRSRLAAHGMDARTLDASVAGKTYYTVALGGRSTDPVRAAGRVLREDSRDAVLEASPERAESLAAAGYEVAKVFLRPVRPAPARPPEGRLRALTPDPLVDAMVASVSSAAIDARVARLEAFGTRFCRSDSAEAAATWVAAELSAAGLDSVSFHTWDPGYSPNVVAVLPGWYEPETAVVIGGHYDSIAPSYLSAPGADDNASGTALVLETARALSGYLFERTLVFVAFGGEELGLLGSEAWAADAAANGDDILAMINADMVGYLAPGDAPDLDVIADNASQWLRDVAKDAGATYVPDLPVIDGTMPGGASSDHASFWAHGFPAVQLWEDDSYSPYIHTDEDRIGASYCSPPLAHGFARLATATAAVLAGPLPLAVAHTPLPDAPASVACRVAARVVAQGSLVPESLELHWSAGGAWQTAPLAPAGPAGEYEAWIPAQPAGARVTYWLAAADAAGATVTEPRAAPAQTHSFYVGQPLAVFADDAETDGGWTCGVPGDDAATGRWVRADPVGTWDLGFPVQPEDDHSPAGACCFVTGNAAAGLPVGVNDVDGGRTTLLSPVLDLAAWPGARVRYWRWYVNDTPIEAATDEWIVDVSSDAGGSWTRLETCASSERSWTLIDRDLAAYVSLTPAVQFRFVASDESTGSFVEAALDDFSVTVFPPGATASIVPGDAPPALALHRPVPNPSAGSCRIAFTAPAGAPVDLRVLDVAGRVVATLVRGGQGTDEASGPHTVTWNGRDDSGAPVAAGVYFLRLEGPGADVRVGRIVRLR